MTNINENLDRWFKEKWVDIYKKVDGKHPPCGREAASKSMAHTLNVGHLIV